MQQFLQNPTDSLVYLQYGASLGAFRDIAGDASKDVIYATSIGVLSDEIGADFSQRYTEKYGPTSSPNGGVQTYEALHQLAKAISLAGGIGEAYEESQNKLVAGRLIASIHRGANGTTRFDQTAQEAFSYPVQTDDPSLGMPHLFSQIETTEEDGKIISPAPYAVTDFRIPHWIDR
jgi:branched-chain amino acid transport system substrate-binding protein